MYHFWSVFITAGVWTWNSISKKDIQSCNAQRNHVLSLLLLTKQECLLAIPHQIRDAHILSTNRFLAKNNLHRLAAKFCLWTMDLVEGVSLDYWWQHVNMEGNHNTDINLWFEKRLFSCDRKTVQKLRHLFASPHILMLYRVAQKAPDTRYGNTSTLDSRGFCSTLYFNNEWRLNLYKWPCERKYATIRSNVSSLSAFCGSYQSLKTPWKLSAVTKQPAD